MLFVEATFLFVFLPTLLLSLYIVTRFKRFDFCLPLLLLGSIIFYGLWSYKYLLMLVCLVSFNYIIARLINQCAHKQFRLMLLVAGLSTHLGLLAYFKYTGFLASLFDITLAIDIILPLAISFYTFQQISFLVDVYKGGQQIVPPVEYFTYIFFFPQLIAGPIVQYQQVGEQLKLFSLGKANPMYALGFSYLAIGLLKKWLIADPLAPLAHASFLHVQLDGIIEPLFAWMGLMAYTFQLYFDFSAYGDMAIGLGLLVGIRLPINFDSPYKASSISAFWRKWHITLGTFLRQYLFIPLGGSRGSSIITARNLFIVMLLGGIWHGAGLGFVLWGVMHGVALIIHQSYKRCVAKDDSRFLSCVYICLTFLFVCLAWVPFKAVSIESTWVMYQSLFSVSEFSMAEQFAALKTDYGLSVMTQSLLLVTLPIMIWGCHNSHVYAVRIETLLKKTAQALTLRWKWAQVPAGLATGISIMLCIKWMAGMPVESFLYFQF